MAVGIEPVAVPIERYSVITCPACLHQAREEMPTDSCTFFHECAGCGTLLKPLVGDCCVFCSYGSVPCSPKQDGDTVCDSSCDSA